MSVFETDRPAGVAMRHRSGVLLGGAALALVGLLLTASPGTAASAPTPAPTSQPPTCPPVLPISGNVSGSTATSLTISYSIFLAPPCGYLPPITVTLFGSGDEARQWQNPLASAVSGPERSGTVTVEGLTPDTVYWFRVSAGGVRDPFVLGPGRTAARAACAATLAIGSAWGTGFVATITVHNAGTEPLGSWLVSWQWPGDQRIGSLWNGVAEDGTTGVTVRNESYNGRLSPGDSTTFGLLGTGGAPPANLALSCA